MRTNRLLLSLLVMLGPATGSVVACSEGDPASGGGGALDGSTSEASGDRPDDSPIAPDDSGASSPKAIAAPVAPVYVGQAVALDGSGSTGPAGFTYDWKITSVPASSTITSASLSGPTTAKPMFVPDLPGEYVLTLTIGAGSEKSTASAKATVVDPPLFYFRTENDASAGFKASLNVVGAWAGDGGTPIGCFESDAGSYDSLCSSTGKVGTDWWEAPAGQPSRIVFVFDTREDAAGTSVLAATTSSASCAMPPTVLDKLSGAPESQRPFEQPRFSPNGERIAYVRNSDGRARIVTTGFDGSNPRELAPFASLSDGGPDPDAPMPPQPGVRSVWIDDTTVTWLQVLEDGKWQIVSAPDAANASATLVMSCSGEAPSQFDFLPSGEVIVSQKLPTVLDALCTPGEPCGSPAINIVAYPINPVTKACGKWRNISKLPGGNGVNSHARDFSLSPDKTAVAYSANNDVAKKTELVIARVDGTTPPRSIAAPLTGANRGPRWVGNGALVSWGIEAAQFDAAASGNAVAVVAADGGAGRAVALAPAGGTVQSIGNGLWCAFGPPVGSGLSLVGLAGLLVVRFVRRRGRTAGCTSPLLTPARGATIPWSRQRRPGQRS